MRKTRKVIKIDEDKCNGCGQCIIACAEGALQIIDGKARLVSEQYCDGLGACLGECPEGAITIEERVAEEFDAQAVEQHLVTPQSVCPGTHPLTFSSPPASQSSGVAVADQAGLTRLHNWPVQLSLVPVEAPYFRGARLVISADCVPFACANFHDLFLGDKILLVGCPKLDDAAGYRQKLAQIFAGNDIQSVEVVHMEVPCCHGLVRLVQDALASVEKSIPLTVTEVALSGIICESCTMKATPDSPSCPVAPA